jgi:hypothetical protein
MDRSRANQILEEWTAVAGDVRRPDAPPRPVVVRGGLPSVGLAGAGVFAGALVIAVLWLGRPPGPNGSVGGPSPVPSASATPAAPSASAIPSATTTPTPEPTSTPTPEPTTTPTPKPTIGPCRPASLSARITLWEGAAGHRIAHVELTNAGSVACSVRVMAKPQLVDGRGSVLIDGTSPSSSGSLTVVPGGLLKTLVQDGNYCGPAPVAPVSVAFVLTGGGRIVATPFSPTDATLPPCNSAPGSAGDIEMQPWAR